MKRWKKVALVLLGLIVLTQIPFIYRRYQLGRLNATIEQLNSQRVVDQQGDSYADHQGAIHVHSMLGGHSTGNFADIIHAAKTNKLAFVVMTEHPAEDLDTAEMTLKGFHGGVLFVNGSEIDLPNEDRLLIIGGSVLANGATPASTQALITGAKASGRLVFVAHPEQFQSWQANGYDGMEIYNLHASTKGINRARLFFDGLWSYWSYPHLLWTTFYEKPSDNLKKWDEMTVFHGRKVVAIAGNDAHANVGLSLQHAHGKKILQLLLDPYERSLHVVRTHLLLEKDRPLNAETLTSALQRGHCYVSFDVLGDATGFRFTAENGAEKKIMGDEIGLAGGVRLAVTTPVQSRIVLVKDGQVLHQEEASKKEWMINQKGVYRVEVYLPQFPKPLSDKPWIISNPIYIGANAK